jgi:recombination protein RecT
MADNPPQPPLLEETDIDKTAAVEQAVQNIAKQPRTVRDLIQGPEFKTALRAVLPRAMRPDRFVRVALTAMMRTPDLAECSRESLFKALLDLSSYGLEPDGRRAHLIPFRNKKMCQCGHEQDAHKGQECSRCDCRQRRTLVECQLILDYKGLAELVRRSGEVSYIHADVVYENDEWDCSHGTGAKLIHKPNLENRGTKRRCFYSYVKLKDGSEDFMVLNPKEVESVRRRSKSPDAGPWVTDYDEMGKKTAFRRHSKWLPLSPEVRDAIEKDDVEAIDISGWDEVLESGEKSAQQLPEGSPSKKLRDVVLGAKAPAQQTLTDPPTTEK